MAKKAGSPLVMTWVWVSIGSSAAKPFTSDFADTCGLDCPAAAALLCPDWALVKVKAKMIESRKTPRSSVRMWFLLSQPRPLILKQELGRLTKRSDLNTFVAFCAALCSFEIEY